MHHMFNIFLMKGCKARIDKEICPFQMEGPFRHEVFNDSFIIMALLKTKNSRWFAQPALAFTGRPLQVGNDLPLAPLQPSFF
jgi:hypothetical protein